MPKIQTKPDFILQTDASKSYVWGNVERMNVGEQRIRKHLLYFSQRGYEGHVCSVWKAHLLESLPTSPYYLTYNIILNQPRRG